MERRSQQPEGQENIQLPVTRAVVFNLHQGRWRGLTWHDQDEEIVWLLGVGQHRSGDHDDAYTLLKQRDRTGTLFPDQDDYADLEPEPLTFVHALAAAAPMMIAQALAEPGQPVASELAGILRVRILVQPIGGTSHGAEIWIGFQMPPLRPNALPPAWQAVAAAAFLPTVAPRGTSILLLSLPRAASSRRPRRGRLYRLSRCPRICACANKHVNDVN